MLVVKLAVLLFIWIDSLLGACTNNPGYILERFLNVGVLLGTDIVDLRNIMLICKLFHLFFVNLVHLLIYLVSHDEYAATGTIVIL
jgi:hypothetical protein